MELVMSCTELEQFFTLNWREVESRLSSSVRASLPSFPGFLSHFLQGKEIGVGIFRAPAEGAELATDETDVGKIDILVYHVSNNVTNQIPAQPIGRQQQTQ